MQIHCFISKSRYFFRSSSVDNDPKYRYIKMQGQTDEENLYRLEQQLRYNDSIQIIRKQVKRYDDLVKRTGRKDGEGKTE